MGLILAKMELGKNAHRRYIAKKGERQKLQLLLSCWWHGGAGKANFQYGSIGGHGDEVKETHKTCVVGRKKRKKRKKKKGKKEKRGGAKEKMERRKEGKK